MKPIKCGKDCRECEQGSVRIDNKGYPFGYECLKYKEDIGIEEVTEEKIFLVDD